MRFPEDSKKGCKWIRRIGFRGQVDKRSTGQTMDRGWSAESSPYQPQWVCSPSATPPIAMNVSEWMVKWTVNPCCELSWHSTHKTPPTAATERVLSRVFSSFERRTQLEPMSDRLVIICTTTRSAMDRGRGIKYIPTRRERATESEGLYIIFFWPWWWLGCIIHTRIKCKKPGLSGWMLGWV